MATVSDIRENRGFIEISLDGVLWLRLRKRHFAQRPVETGQPVDAQAYLDAMASVQAADCYEAALTILDQADHSMGDLCARLERRGYVQPAAQAAVERLQEMHIIDDARYADRIAQAQMGKAVGAYAVRRKLRAKRLSEETIEAAMEGFDDAQQEAACRAAAEKLFRKYGALPAREGRAKLSQALARRGFGWDAIRSVVDALFSDSCEYED